METLIMSASRGLSTSPLSAPRLSKAAGEAVFCFAIQAEAEPGVMPRVLELFAKRGLIPLRLHADRIGLERKELAIDLQVSGLEQQACNYIARCLRQIHGVEAVLTSEKSQE